MRASVLSFKSEIAAYRQRLITGTRSKDQHWKCQLALKLLDRWEQHPEVETIWNEISQKLPAADPTIAGEFIERVITCRVQAERLDEIARGGPCVEAKARAHVKRDLLTKSDRKAIEKLTLIANLNEGRKRLLSRKTDTAARQHFMLWWRDTLKQLCGQPFHHVVAVLTNIAFDLKPKRPGIPPRNVEVTEDDVKKVRPPIGAVGKI